jgi:monofunctional biosynthetic peptidoglycan transglycosylase
MFKKALKLSALFLLFFIISSVIHVLCIGYFHHTWSPLMVIRNYEALDKNSHYTATQYYTPIDSVSPKMVLAVMCAEDINFPYHNGFDFDAIQKAREYNKTHEKTIGASTISQQTAKNVFLWQKRNWVRKGFEAYYTFLIETLWSKKRIMEAYLNVIEMGDGIYGVEAASHYYYEENALRLNKDESAALAAIFPNPRKRDPRKPDKETTQRIGQIKNCMRVYKKLLTDIGITEKKPVKKRKGKSGTGPDQTSTR